MNAPCPKFWEVQQPRMILANFIEGINEEEDELDGIAIFGSDSLYVVMGIQKFRKSAEIYDMCAPGRTTNQAEQYLLNV